MSFVGFYSVTKEYSKNIKVLDKISFSVDKGDFVVILGESKSGKTTILNLLGGIDIATSGDILVDKENIVKLSLEKLIDYRKEIGFIFQSHNIISNLNVFDNVDIVSSLVDNSLDAKRILKLVGVEKINSFPFEITNEDLQKVNVARAICKNGKMLLCDEPIKTLNSEEGKLVLELLYKAAKMFNKPVIIATTNNNIAKVADKVIYLKNGKVTKIEKNENPLPIEKVVL